MPSTSIVFTKALQIPRVWDRLLGILAFDEGELPPSARGEAALDDPTVYRDDDRYVEVSEFGLLVVFSLHSGNSNYWREVHVYPEDLTEIHDSDDLLSEDETEFMVPSSLDLALKDGRSLLVDIVRY